MGITQLVNKVIVGVLQSLNEPSGFYWYGMPAERSLVSQHWWSLPKPLLALICSLAAHHQRSSVLTSWYKDCLREQLMPPSFSDHFHWISFAKANSCLNVTTGVCPGLRDSTATLTTSMEWLIKAMVGTLSRKNGNSAVAQMSWLASKSRWFLCYTAHDMFATQKVSRMILVCCSQRCSILTCCLKLLLLRWDFMQVATKRCSCCCCFVQVSLDKAIGQMSRVFQETGFLAQVKSYQRLKKWYLMPPCLTLGIRR